MTQHHKQWQPIRIYGEGLNPHTGRTHNCLPAWDVTGIYDHADDWIAHPDHDRKKQGLPGEHPDADKRMGVFWNRHVDRRFYISYPHASKDSPRAQGRTIGDPIKEWDVVSEYRDRILADAGLTKDDDQTAVAKALADSFLEDKFNLKPMCTTFDENPRELSNGVEGLLHKSFCVGCARAFAMMVDMLHMPTRTIGCNGHIIAEVQIDGKWRLVENVGRHTGNGNEAFFSKSYVESYLDPMGDIGAYITDEYREGLFKRCNPQFHFGGGMWESANTLRYAMQCAAACYPGLERYGIKEEGTGRLPITRRLNGFYWPSAHSSETEELNVLRNRTLPKPISDVASMRDFFFYQLKKGQILRQSVWLDSLEDMKSLEVVFSFAPSKEGDYGSPAGDALMVRVGKWSKSLNELKAWPPRNVTGQTADQPLDANDNLHCTVEVPISALQANAVNWIELIHDGESPYHMPCVPAAMEPYSSPVWSETSDVFKPARESNKPATI